MRGTAPRRLIKQKQRDMRKVSIRDITFEEISDDWMSKQIEIKELTSGQREFDTLSDPRLGPVGRGSECGTCHLTSRECKGHIGQISLPYPYIKPSRVRSVIEVLNCICTTCRRCYLGLEKLSPVLDKYDKTYWRKYIENLTLKSASHTRFGCRTPECPDFGTRRQFSKKGTKKSREFIYNHVDMSLIDSGMLLYEDIHKILKSIPLEDLQILGLEHTPPVNWVLHHVVVLPTCVRPSNVIRGIMKNHEYTMIYKKILTESIRMRGLGSNEAKQRSAMSIMNHIDQLINVPGADSQSKSLSQYIGGKHGLIRRGISGKKSRHSGRFVIVPGPDVPWGYMGIPSNIAKSCLVPVTYGLNNQQSCSHLIYDGKAVGYCPAGSDDYIPLSKKGTPYLDSIVAGLRLGDIIYRSLEDGDPVFVIRQPSIHKYSVMGFKAKIADKGYTLLVHPGVTPAFCGDYDGDEMNLYIPQTEEAMAEVLTLMSITKCQVSPYDISSAYGLTYDSLLGMHMIQTFGSVDKIIFTQMIDLLRDNGYSQTLIPRLILEGQISYEDIGSKPGDDLSNAQLLLELDKIRPNIAISLLFHPEFVYVYNGVKIRNGILNEGKLGKSHIGVGGLYTIQNLLSTDYSEQILSRFYDDIYKMTYLYMDRMGFTISIRDCYPTEGKHMKEEYKSELMKTHDEAISNYYTFVSKMDVDEIMDNPLYRRIYEKEAPLILNTMASTIDITDKYYRNPNNMIFAVQSGSKGSMSNVNSMVGNLGQIYPGSRLPQSGEDTIHRHGSIDPTRFGYCTRSYLEGVDPETYKQGTIATRYSMSLLYVQSGPIGTKRRQMLNASKEIYTNEYGAVVDHSGNIIQFLYGSDNVRPQSQTMISIDSRNIFSAGSLHYVSEMINYKYSGRR